MEDPPSLFLEPRKPATKSMELKAQPVGRLHFSESEDELETSKDALVGGLKKQLAQVQRNLAESEAEVQDLEEVLNHVQGKLVLTAVSLERSHASNEALLLLMKKEIDLARRAPISKDDAQNLEESLEGISKVVRKIVNPFNDTADLLNKFMPLYADRIFKHSEHFTNLVANPSDDFQAWRNTQGFHQGDFSKLRTEDEVHLDHAGNVLSQLNEDEEVEG